MFALASCRTDRLTGPPNPPATVSDTIAYWTFDGNLKDVTGNGHDGTSKLSIFGTDRFGKPDGAVLMPPTMLAESEVITVQNATDLDFKASESYSISMWVKPSGSDTNVFFAKTPSVPDGLRYQIGSVGGHFFAWIGSGYPLAILTSDSVSLNQWHMVTFEFGPYGMEKLYVDSSEANDAMAYTDTLLWLQPGSPFQILGSIVDLPYSVDDILFLHHAMSPIELQARFHEGGWYEHTDTVVVTPPPTTDSIWTSVDASTSNDLVVGQFVNSSTGFVGGAYGVFLATNDSGATWSIRTSPTIFTGSLTGHIYGLSFFDANHGVAAGDQNDISITSDGGNNWTLVDASNLPQTDLIRSLCFTNRNTGFVGTSDAYANPSGSICRSNDGGQTWSAPIISTGGGIYNIDFNTLSNNQNGVATGNYGVVYWTNDGGTTWNPGTSDLSTGIIIRTTFMTATTAF
ncbi:MAG TPA: YCF48-related protein, partial [Candidatus Kapabacteria bacterium]|nr:YCF48-related protein [Candidatus Kapabacteria bacterium]